MSNLNKATTAFLLIAILTMVAFISVPPAKAAAANTTIKIGVVTDRSTALSYYGDMEINGLVLGLAYSLGVTNLTSAITSTPDLVTVTGGGYTFQIYIADSASNPTTAQQKAVQLITQDGVQILQGSASSSDARAIQNVAKQYQVVFFAAPAADYDITAQNFNVYTFRMASNTYQDALTGGAYAAQNLGKSFAFIAPDYSWGYGEVSSWSDVIANNGGKVVNTQYVPLGTTDFTPYINKVMASNASVLIPVWAGAGAIQLYQQLYSLGAYSKMNVTSGIPDLATFQLIAQYMPNYEGMMKYSYNLPNNTVNDWLIQNYVSLFKQDKLPAQNALTFPLPDLFIPDSFATGQAIVTALNKTGGSTNSANLIAALEGMTLETPKGTMYIRPQDHQALQDMYVVKTVYDNSSFHQYYSGASEFPAGSNWAPVFNTGFMGVQLITTLNMSETAPPIDASAALQPRPQVSTTTSAPSTTTITTQTTITTSQQPTTTTTSTIITPGGYNTTLIVASVAVAVIVIVAALFIFTRRKT